MSTTQLVFRVELPAHGRYGPAGRLLYLEIDVAKRKSAFPNLSGMCFASFLARLCPARDRSGSEGHQVFRRDASEEYFRFLLPKERSRIMQSNDCKVTLQPRDQSSDFDSDKIVN